MQRGYTIATADQSDNHIGLICSFFKNALFLWHESEAPRTAAFRTVFHINEDATIDDKERLCVLNVTNSTSSHQQMKCRAFVEFLFANRHTWIPR